MASTFGGLDIVKKGLFAQQRALDVTGHNISNVNTPGYSRQRANMETTTPHKVTGGWGMLGSGVQVSEITRIRDTFLDVKYWEENKLLGEWETKSTQMTSLEELFNEPSDTGINTVLSDFISALDELSKDAGSLTVRVLVQQRAQDLTQTLNQTAMQLKQAQEDMNFLIKAKVDEVNSYAVQISELNAQIFRNEIDGSIANDLRDKRDLLIDELSKIADIRVVEDTEGRFRVYAGGRVLVNHIYYNQLEAVKRVAPKNPDVDVPELYEVVWDDGMQFNLGSGELKGLIDVRDGNGTGTEYKGIPYYMSELNRFATTFAYAINYYHYNGYDLSGNNNQYFFTVDGEDSATFDARADDYSIADPFAVPPFSVNINVKTVKAESISISQEIELDPNAIAAAEDAALVPSDARVALYMAQLRDTKIFPQYGMPEDFMKSVISALGVDVQEAERISSNEQILVNNIDDNRQSVAGVSIDEEMTNMVKYQHSYNAAARMITTMDEMIDVVVNKMGLVGR